MSVTREELHHLVDELPERVRERMHGVTGADEELQRLRDEGP
jgi:hypothetical protein